MRKLLVSILLLSTSVFAQDQMTVRLNEQGLVKVLKYSLKYNTGTNTQSFVVPKSIYSFKVKKSNLLSNPIVNVVNQISNLNLTKDLPFYLLTSDIKITGTADPKSLVTSISNSTSEGFDFKIQINIPKVTVTGSSMSLCEDRIARQVKCGSGLKASVSSVKVNTVSRPVVLSAVLRVTNKNGKASVKVKSVSSNLESKSAPGIDIALGNLTIPRIAIVINGNETELDTSNLKNEILKNKNMLGKELLAFAGEFIAEDLAEMVNKYLANASVSTNVTVYRHSPAKELYSYSSYDYKFPTVAVDNTYVHRPYIPDLNQKEKIDLNSLSKTPSDILEEQIAKMIRSADVSLAFKNIKTPNNKDIQIGGSLGMKLNGYSINVQNRLGNRAATLPTLDLNAKRNNDINLVISEPVINGALDVISKTGLFEELAKTFAGVKGFAIKSVQLHFATGNTIKAIVNSEIDLNQLESNGFGSWFKNQWAAWRERNNNNGRIYFPIEVAINPSVVSQNTGAKALSLYVKSPFNNEALINSYGYPSNVGNMKSEVKSGLLGELKKALGSLTEKAFVVDITKFMNQSGVTFNPKNISIDKSAYLVIDLDIKDINLKAKK